MNPAFVQAIADLNTATVDMLSNVTVTLASTPGTSTGTSTGNKLNPAGTYTFAGTKIISPGDTVSLSGTITSGALSEIKSITFSTVPEPSTYALGAIATGVMAAIARRRKARKA